MSQISVLLQHVRRGSRKVHYRGLLIALSETNQSVIVKDILKEDITENTSEDSIMDVSDGQYTFITIYTEPM